MREKAAREAIRYFEGGEEREERLDFLAQVVLAGWQNFGDRLVSAPTQTAVNNVSSVPFRTSHHILFPPRTAAHPSAHNRPRLTNQARTTTLFTTPAMVRKPVVVVTGASKCILCRSLPRPPAD